MEVSEDQVQRFQEEGAILVKGALSHHWIQKIEAGIQRNLENPSEYSENLKIGQGAYFNDYCNWQKIPEFREFVFESGISRLAASLMKSDYAVFYHEHVLNKEPGAEKETPWHQDQAYYPLDGWNMLSIWIPVDPVPLQSTLRFVKGSHKWGWFHPRKFATERNYPVERAAVAERVYQDVPDQDIKDGKHQILEWACQPGDVVVFHGMELHGARGNASATTQRRVLSTRWAGRGTVLADRPWQVSPPVTGELQVGDVFQADIFPVVYGRIN